MKTFYPSWDEETVKVATPRKDRALPGPWLLIDVNNLSWRAFHTKKGLSYGGEPTGVIYGVLQDIKKLKDKFGSNSRPVFCFDRGRPKRLKVYKAYKANREMTRERREVRRQTALLREEVLNDLGYCNVFSAHGYEADDVIASLVNDDLSLLKHRSMIVSGDQDLYQLLKTNVFQYHPVSQKVVTPGSFFEQYGIRPTAWPMVKALAGCETDNVKGIKGVGEKTAIDYMAGRPSRNSGLITSEAMVWAVETNLPLVCLPYPGCPDFDLREDETDPDKWSKVCRRFGIRSLGA